LATCAACGETTVIFASPSVMLLGAVTRPSKGRLSFQPSFVAWSRSSRPWATLATTERPEVRVDGGGAQLVGVVAEDVVERVVPERADVVGLRLLVVGELDHLLAEVGEADDVVGVDVADHREVDAEHAAGRARRAQLLEPRAHTRGVGVHGTPVDEDQAVADEDEQRVAVERLQCFECEDRAHTDWIARSASTTPAPWK
jgi:hypothetical protein